MKRVGKVRVGVAVRVQFWVSRECAERLRKVSHGFKVEPEVLAKSLFMAALEFYLPPKKESKVLVGVDVKPLKGIRDVGQIVDRLRVGQR